MTITATFGSVEEMQEFAALMAGRTDVQTGARQPEEKKLTKSQKKPEPEETVQQTPDTESDAAPAVEAEQEETAYTLEEVRAKLAGLQKAGKRAEVKELLSSFGVSKLSELPAARYADLMVKAGEI